MPRLRSETSTQGRNMAGARALWRATGMKDVLFDRLACRARHDAVNEIIVLRDRKSVV